MSNLFARKASDHIAVIPVNCIAEALGCAAIVTTHSAVTHIAATHIVSRPVLGDTGKRGTGDKSTYAASVSVSH